MFANYLPLTGIEQKIRYAMAHGAIYAPVLEIPLSASPASAGIEGSQRLISLFHDPRAIRSLERIAPGLFELGLYCAVLGSLSAFVFIKETPRGKIA